MQLYKPSFADIAGVILSADARAHPATGAPRAWARSVTPSQAATQALVIMQPFTQTLQTRS